MVGSWLAMLNVCLCEGNSNRGILGWGCFISKYVPERQSFLRGRRFFETAGDLTLAHNGPLFQCNQRKWFFEFDSSEL